MSEPEFDLGHVVESLEGELWHVTERFEDLRTAYIHYTIEDYHHIDSVKLREDNAMMQYEATEAKVKYNTAPVEVFGE